MPAHPRRPFRLVLVPALVALWIALFGAVPASAATATSTIKYSRELYFAGSYERQVDSRTCTAASTAMMMNMIDRQDLNLPQMSILRFAQRRDALVDAVQRGSDPLGWSKAASYYSRYTDRPTVYRWEAFPTKAAALKRAATQLAVTSKPIGLVIRHGTHAVVMTGIRTTANPIQTQAFGVHSFSVSDPYGSAHTWYLSSSSLLDTYRELDATTVYDQAWYGKFVIIVPQG